MSKITEAMVQKAALEFLTRIPGALVWRNNTVGIYDKKTGRYRSNKGLGDPKGSPDIIMLLAGKFYGFEIKSPDNKVRPSHQIAFLERVRQSGGVGEFIDSLSQIKEILHTSLHE